MDVMIAPAAARRALLVEVAGVVQGVGFRPFVHRLAVRHALDGWVRNRAGDVEIALEGPPDSLDGFLAELDAEAPPLARIDRVTTVARSTGVEPGFRILASEDRPDRRQPIAADVATCDACRRELFDAADRRYRYPFITCTDCGPRYSIIEAMPYDRERTTMRMFTQCARCRGEYETPGDRRHHSETNSCPDCGPRLWVLERVSDGVRELAGDPIEHAARLVRAGSIVALRGIGGFHLACDATNDHAVRFLRLRKHREGKPLAIMVRTLAEARQLAFVGREAARLLTARERPIVLLVKRDPSTLAPSVAPGLAHVGIMLAYSPLHHLLLERIRRPLVMTSGNLSDEPLVASNDEALARLGNIADAFVLHDREIAARIDDSVVRLAAGAPAFLRRARGYAPLPLPLPVATSEPLVAVGPHLKNTFTLAVGADAYVSQHIGDLDSLETLEHWRGVYDTFRRRFRIEPSVVARDVHPGYLSTRVAAELGVERTITVQHHHAHIAAVLGEHDVREPVLGVAFDGTGYGDDGTVWGAEFLLADLAGYTRVGHLRQAPLPGGERAVRSPWRAALGYASLEPDAAPFFAQAMGGVADAERTLAERQLARGINSPLASSMGRLFDTAAAVLGVRRVSRYEGEAAMMLEALAGKRAGTVLPFTILERAPAWVLDPIPLLVALAERHGRGEDVGHLAAAFHDTVAAMTFEMATGLAQANGVQTVALGGGVFQNARLLESLRARLEAGGLRVLAPRLLPANDGGVSYGQACVAATILARGG